jgi:ABC-2 type transport system ATP-binding protein
MKLLLGLLRPSNGSARVLGFDCTRQAREVKARIGYTPDEPQFYDFLTGRETIDFVIHARDLKRGAAWSVAEEIVQLLELRPQLDVTTGAYSLGMKKKLSLLCALLHRPKVLLLDEPTNGLDPPTAHRVRELLRKQARAGTAVLLSTHLLDMAERMCDRILLIDEGQTVACGSAADLRATAGVATSACLEDAVLQLLGRG